MRKFNILFIVLAALVFVSLLPGAVTIGTLLFVLPGLILLAASTALYYLLWLTLTTMIYRRAYARCGSKRTAFAAGAAALVCATALPHLWGGLYLGWQATSDFSSAAVSVKPKSVELPYAWARWDRPIRRVTNNHPRGQSLCGDFCQQLLFKGYVEEVFIPNNSQPRIVGTIVIRPSSAIRIKPNGSAERLPALSNTPYTQRIMQPANRQVWRFHLETRDACPDTLSYIQSEFVRDVISGRCLIEELVDDTKADVVLDVNGSDETHYDVGNCHNRLSDLFEPVAIQRGPSTITISERRGDALVAVERKRTLKALYAPWPFYFGVHSDGRSDLADLCPAAATVAVEMRGDPFEMMSRRYQFDLRETPRNARFDDSLTEADRATVEAIVLRDYGSDGFMPETQANFVASFLMARLRKAPPSDSDIDLIKLVLKQPSFELSIFDYVLPATYDRLKPLLPDIFERLSRKHSPPDDMEASLDRILGHYPAEVLEPYAPPCFAQYKGDIPICKEAAPGSNSKE